jgi:hypothetical protein
MKDIIDIIILIPFCLLFFVYIRVFFIHISTSEEKKQLNPINCFKHDNFSEIIIDLLLTILGWITIGYMIYILLTPFLCVLKIINK